MPDAAAYKRSAKPEQCLDAARCVFTQHGYGAASMDAVAAQAGVSKATVYAHFGSKEGLFAAMMRRECRRCMDQMAIPDDVHELDLRAALQRIAGSFLDAGLNPRILAILRAVIAESARFPELGDIFYRSGPRSTLEGVVAYLDRACERGLLRITDTETVAIQFLGMLRGDLQLRALAGLPVPREEVKRATQTAVDAFLRAYGATGSDTL